MRLYHVPNTRGSRVIWILEEAGIPYELERISREDTRTPKHLARHPLGKVPVVELDDGFFFESAAHMLYAADLDPSGSLVGPVGSYDRALAYQWMFFAASELEPHVLEVLRAGDDGDPKAKAAAAERIRKATAALESALDGHEYLVADRFGVADVIVSAMLLFARRLGLLDETPNVEAYLERIEARPARQRALEIASAPG
jgi:glutathione S-transferase